MRPESLESAMIREFDDQHTLAATGDHLAEGDALETEIDDGYKRRKLSRRRDVIWHCKKT